jgi:hypothetical protein
MSVTKAASGDELFGSFAEAAFVTALRLFTGLDIQEHKDRKESLSDGSGDYYAIFVTLRGKKSDERVIAASCTRSRTT